MSASQTCWPRVLATLSLDLFEPFQPAVGIELASGDVKVFCRECLTRHIPEYKSPPAKRSTRCRMRENDLAEVKRAAHDHFGLASGSAFIGHMEWVWADIHAVWDWFAYEMVFGGHWPGISPSRVDPLGIGPGAPRVYELYDAAYREPVRTVCRLVDALPEAPLSEWDAKVFSIREFTFEEFTPDAALWFQAWVDEAIRREYFYRFHGALLAIIDSETELRIRETVKRVLLAHTSYRAGRPLALLSELEPRRV